MLANRLSAEEAARVLCLKQEEKTGIPTAFSIIQVDPVIVQAGLSWRGPRRRLIGGGEPRAFPGNQKSARADDRRFAGVQFPVRPHRKLPWLRPEASSPERRCIA